MSALSLLLLSAADSKQVVFDLGDGYELRCHIDEESGRLHLYGYGKAAKVVVSAHSSNHIEVSSERRD